MASMHAEGAGCERSFSTALALMARFHNEASSITRKPHIGDAGPSFFELLTEFKVSVNGNKAYASIAMLEELVNWLVSCKRKVIAKQTEILKKKPEALGGTGYRRLPFKGSIGGVSLLLKGKNKITHVGLRNSLLNDQIWFESSQFSGWPADTSFGNLTNFEDIPTTELEEIQLSYETHKTTGKLFLLKLFNTSVSRGSEFYCGDKVIMNRYED